MFEFNRFVLYLHNNYTALKFLVALIFAITINSLTRWHIRSRINLTALVEIKKQQYK